jgi:hypothetical protein
MIHLTFTNHAGIYSLYGTIDPSNQESFYSCGPSIRAMAASAIRVRLMKPGTQIEIVPSTSVSAEETERLNELIFLHTGRAK